MVSIEHMDAENIEKKSKIHIEKTVLDSFSKLTNNNSNVRTKSSSSLVRYLIENESNEKLNNESKYALKRLIRGLGSSTNNARSGFYSTLVTLLNFKTDINVEDILEIISTELHKSAKNNDGGNADICTGQILTCGAVIRSKIWERTSKDTRDKVIDIILNSSKERSYLGLLGYSFLAEIDDVCFEKTIFKHVKDVISKIWDEQNLDTLFLILVCKNKCPNKVTSKFLQNSLGTPDIICKESTEKIANVLMTIPRVSSLNHPVYNLVSSEISKSNHLKIFSNNLDKQLKLPNRNRILAILKINILILNSISESNTNLDQIPEILTTNFIKHTINYFKSANKDPEFQKNVHTFFESLLNAVKNQNTTSETKILILKKLLLYPGTFVFEKVTKSKIIQHITATLDSQGVKDLAKLYTNVTEGTERIDSIMSHNEHWLNNDRLYSTHLLLKLLNHSEMKMEIEWKAEILENLMKMSIFKMENEVNIGRELADSLKNAFFGALDLKLSKIEHMQIILSKLIHQIDFILTQNDRETVLRHAITDETYDIFKRTVEIITKIEQKKKTKNNNLQSVFLTLFLHLGLQIFNDIKLASDSLNELFACYEKVNKKHKNDTNDPEWIEVVTDLFLNLLSQNSHLLRRVINIVFPYLCVYMNSNTIHQILSVLDPKNEENPLTSDNFDSDSEEDDNNEASSSDSSEEGEEEEESDAEEEETSNDRLRMALHGVLSNNGNVSDAESVNLSDMSETEGNNLDKAISEVFKQYRPNYGRRKKQTKDEETLTHFRIRVLDLVEIYLDSGPSMYLALEVMLPLLQSVEFSVKNEHEKPLFDRLKSVLKKFVNIKKFNDYNDVNGDILSDLLRSLLEKGSKNVFLIQEMSEQISDCCMFVLKCSEMLLRDENVPKPIKKSLKKPLTEIMSIELQHFFTKRDSSTPYVLFKHVFNLNNFRGNISLASILLGYVFNSEIKNFKRNQATELLKIFYGNQRYISGHLEKIRKSLEQEHKVFSDETIEFFQNLIEGQDEKNKISERFICNIFSLLTIMKNSILQIENIDWIKIGEVIREFRTYKKFSKDAKIAFNKLCRSLKISNIVKMKNNLTDLKSTTKNDEIPENSKNKIKKNKKANKDKLKLKKEAKNLRLQSLSEGFSSNFDTNFKRTFSESDDSASLQNGDISTNHIKKKHKNS